MLTDKLVVVTGATAGIGWQAALDFARAGAKVIGAGRSAERCARAREQILHACPQAKISFVTAELASQVQVKRMAGELLEIAGRENGGRLDVLINNAGLSSQKRILTEDGIEQTFAVNHLAVVLLTYLLLPALQKTPGSRLLTVSSNSHYKTWFNPVMEKNPPVYFGLWAYKVSKLANVLFTQRFNRMMGGTPPAFAVDPGLVATDIGLKDPSPLARMIWRGRQKIGDAPEKPVKTLLHLAQAEGPDCLKDPYWRDCKPKPASRAAWDDGLIERTWQESCRLCGIAAEWNECRQ
jgi:NAD(P)-dependent dehydrogenase (short-subunit alcohol dehydrogenase family)